MPRMKFPRAAGILGVGVDCEEISRFGKMDRKAIGKIFTKKEMEYCRSKANPSQHFAARFAGKEAVIKCFGAIGKKIPFSQIEIIKYGNSAPAASILDKNLRGYDAMLSLSHSGDMAIAFAVLKKKR
jgi:phosphopantetheine--protein transferase-like protein